MKHQIKEDKIDKLTKLTPFGSDAIGGSKCSNPYIQAEFRNFLYVMSYLNSGVGVITNIYYNRTFNV